MLQFFKTPAGIALGVIATLGILAIIGYNNWGWFGGSDKWKAEHPNNTGGTGTGANTGSGGRFSNSYSSDEVTVIEDESENARMAGNGANVQWNYEYVKQANGQFALVGYVGQSVPSGLNIKDYIKTSPKSGIFRIVNINKSTTAGRDQVVVVFSGKPNLTPPNTGSIEKTSVVVPPTTNMWQFYSADGGVPTMKLRGSQQITLPNSKQIKFVDKNHNLFFDSTFKNSYNNGKEWIVEIDNSIVKFPSNSQGYISW